MTLLVEDETLERFARSVLITFGFIRHELRILPYPVGRNAKQWVTQEYPNQVRAHRREANHQRIGLLVGTEADEQTVSQRCAGLASSLAETNNAPREPSERIVLWIPKWHIETWILFLSGHPVTEDENYKHRIGNPDFGAVGREFVQRFRGFQREQLAFGLPSLENAYRETERLGV